MQHSALNIYHTCDTYSMLDCHCLWVLGSNHTFIAWLLVIATNNKTVLPWVDYRLGNNHRLLPWAYSWLCKDQTFLPPRSLSDDDGIEVSISKES